MYKLVTFTTIFILFVLFIIPGILAMGIKMVPGYDQPGFNSDKRLSIYGERVLEQKFVSTQNNLTSVATSIRNPNLKNKKEVIFRLFDKSGNEIRTSVLNGQNFEDGDFVKFIFDPVDDSLNKSYSFTLSSPSAGPEETIEVFIIDATPSYIIEYTYDKNTYPGGIPLVTFYKPSGSVEVVKKVYSNWFSRLLHLDFRIL